MSSPARKKINAFIKSDRAIVLICLIMALFAWLIIKLNKEYSQNFIFPLAFQLEEHLTFAEQPPAQINAQLRAKGWTLMRLGWRKKDTLALSLTDFKIQTLGSRQSLEENFKQLDVDQAEIEVIYPEEINLTLVEKYSKKVPVHIAGEVVIAPQHQLREIITIEPDSVTLWGPKINVDPINHWTTIPWTHEPLNEDLRTTIPLASPTPSLIQLDYNACEVNIPVEEITEKDLIIPIDVVDSLKGQVQIFPDKALLKCTVGLTKFDQIKEDQFTLIATPGTDLKRWKVELIRQPAEITLLDISPKSVEYFLINP
jgi:hypothetical protein